MAAPAPQRAIRCGASTRRPGGALKFRREGGVGFTDAERIYVREHHVPFYSHASHRVSGETEGPLYPPI